MTFYYILLILYFYSCLLIRLLWHADIPVCRTNKGILILILIQSHSWELHEEVSDVIFWSVINKKMFLISYHVMFVMELLKKENNSGKNGTGGSSIYRILTFDFTSNLFLHRLTFYRLILSQNTSKTPHLLSLKIKNWPNKKKSEICGSCLSSNTSLDCKYKD